MWCHVICANYISETRIDGNGAVCNVDRIHPRRYEEECAYCGREKGAKVVCSIIGCSTICHASCGLVNGCLLQDLSEPDEDESNRVVYCPAHYPSTIEAGGHEGLKKLLWDSQDATMNCNQNNLMSAPPDEIFIIPRKFAGIVPRYPKKSDMKQCPALPESVQTDDDESDSDYDVTMDPTDYSQDVKDDMYVDEKETFESIGEPYEVDDPNILYMIKLKYQIKIMHAFLDGLKAEDIEFLRESRAVDDAVQRVIHECELAPSYVGGDLKKRPFELGTFKYSQFSLFSIFARKDIQICSKELRITYIR